VQVTNADVVNVQDPSVFEDSISNQFVRYIFFTIPEVTFAFLHQVDLKVESTTTAEALMFVSFLDEDGCPSIEDITQDTSQASRLTFSKAGGLSLSALSVPPLKAGTWMLAFVQMTDRSSNVPLKPIGVQVSSSTGTQIAGATAFFAVFPVGMALLWAYFEYYGHRLEPDMGFVKAKRRMWSMCKLWFWGPNDYYVLLARPFSFPWYTISVGCAFGVASFQFVSSYWSLMRESGNRDICYYNDQCYHPLSTWDVPFNNILSNLSFIALGLIYNWYVSWQECYRRPGQDFSLFYALGWCLIGVGVFSGFYHICPSRTLFQLDTSFMFATTSMGSISLYQTGESDRRVRAAKYFVFFYIPLISFNYFGIRAEAGAGSWALYWVIFFAWACSILWYVFKTFRLPKLLVPSAHMDIVRSESSSRALNKVEEEPQEEVMEIGHGGALEQEENDAETEAEEPVVKPRIIAKSSSGSVLSYAHDPEGQMHTNVFLCKVEYVDTSEQRNFWARGLKGQIAFGLFAAFFCCIFILRASRFIVTPIASLLLFVLVATTGLSVATLGLYRFPTFTFRNKVMVAVDIALYVANFGAGLSLFMMETTNKNALPSESRALNGPCVFLDYFDL